MTVEAHYTTAELVKLLNCSEDVIYAAAHKGELKGVRVGKQWRFAESAVDEYLNRQNGRDAAATNILPFAKPARSRRPA